MWQVLMDFAAFPEWNPFIRRIEGRPELGSRLDVMIGASGTRGMRFRPIVTKVVPNREFRWLGKVGLPRLFDGEHIFELRPSGAHATQFVQRERFRGLLVPLLARRLKTDVRRGFDEMNRALRIRLTPPSEPGSPAGKA